MFVTGTCWLAVVPTGTPPKSTVPVGRPICGAVAVPVSVDGAGMLGALPVTETVALRAPRTPLALGGENTTWNVQLAPPETFAPVQLSFFKAKLLLLVPPNETVPTVRVAVPVFATLNVCGLDVVPSSCVPKSFDGGFRVTGPICVPVPLSETETGLGVSGSFSVIFSVPFAAPGIDGLN